MGSSTGKQPAYRRVNIACQYCRGRKFRVSTPPLPFSNASEHICQCETPGDGQPCRRCIETDKECVYGPMVPPHPGPQQYNFIPMSPHDLSRGPSQQPGMYGVESRFYNPPSAVIDRLPHLAQSIPVGYNQTPTFSEYSHPGGMPSFSPTLVHGSPVDPSQPTHSYPRHSSGSQTSTPHEYSHAAHGENLPAGPSLGHFPPSPGPSSTSPPPTAGDFFPHNPDHTSVLPFESLTTH